MHTHKHTQTHARTNTRTQKHTHKHTHSHTQVDAACVPTFVLLYSFKMLFDNIGLFETHAHTPMHTHTHTHIHTHIKTHTCTKIQCVCLHFFCSSALKCCFRMYDFLKNMHTHTNTHTCTHKHTYTHAQNTHT
jgi:hypothetical protein